ncbi:putative dynein assembly factor 3, axonemal-like [Penaeus vannamei]|uniref:Putative dynein assembly factor 3, axonemal-like n=1 Tax=Penaeus vannamei TaxID=6689 RepID=A0A423TTH8_PENVA|nr:putative dynein assembly factor 3, axonemal-like [Penaeus vannamei]
MHGHGLFNWWGFSPALNFLNYINDGNKRADLVQVLVVGAGDIRHLLMTLADVTNRPGARLTVYVLEAQVELYARLLVLLGACLEPGFGLRERANLLLDLWGNLCLRPVTKDYLEVVSRRFCLWVTDAARYPSLLGIVSCSRLKYRERDALDAVFRSWYTLSHRDYDPPRAWDVRLRQLFKTRYDYRQADAEWAWHMRMTYRLRELPGVVGGERDGRAEGEDEGKVSDNQDGYVGVGAGWGEEFLEWRMCGHAFVTATDSRPILANTTLASVATVHDGCSRHRRVGYWGDNGTQIAQWNLENLLGNLWKRSACKSSSDSSEATSDSSSEAGSKSSDASASRSSATSDEAESKSDDEQDNESNGSGSINERRDGSRDGSKSGSSDGTSGEWSRSGEESSGTETGSGDGTGTGSSGTSSGSSGETGTGSGEGEKTEASGDGSKSDSNHSSSDISSNSLNDDSVSGSDNCSGNDSSKGSINESKAESQDNQHGKENEWKGKKDEGKMTKNHNEVEEGKEKAERTKENIQQDSKGKETQNEIREEVHEFNEQHESRPDPSGRAKKLSSSSQSSTKDEEHRTAENYLRVEGVEVVLLSPTRLNDLSTLSEIQGGLDMVYLSVATAHLLTPSLAHAHILPETTLLLETARMFPELTDAQVAEYEARVRTSAEEAGWVAQDSPPLCHLRFGRKM